MFKKLALILAVLAIVAAAGTVPGIGHYRVTLYSPATVQGTVLKAGDYSLILKDANLTIKPDSGKTQVEVTVKVEATDKKFDSTLVVVDTKGSSPVISEIRLGGTKTKLIFNN